MNKEIVSMSDNAIVLDENGNQEKREYSDNLNEILVVENIIEKLEEKGKRISKQMANRMNEILSLEKEKKKTKIIMSVIYVIFLFLPFIFNINNIVTAILSCTLFNTVARGYVIVLFNGAINDYKNQIEGNKAEINYINNELKYQKEYLEKLEKEKTKKEDISDELKLEKVNDEEKINEVNQKLKLYYKCGYYYDKLLKLHDKDKLKEKINIYFKESEAQQVEEYVEEQSKKLELEK